MQGMLHAAQTVISNEGVLGLWRGTLPAVQRAALVNLGELATYDQVFKVITVSGWILDIFMMLVLYHILSFRMMGIHCGLPVPRTLLQDTLTSSAWSDYENSLRKLILYSQAKQAVIASDMIPDGVATHAAASCASGLVATTVSTPADVVKTRLMGQDPSRPQYRGAIDCLVRSVRQEGVMSLYKG